MNDQMDWEAPQIDTEEEPPSFDMRYLDAWARSALDNGLPTPPEESRESEMVPVACWAGPDRGVVMFVGGCDHDPLCVPPEPPHRVLWSIPYHRATDRGGRWERAGSWGGSTWSAELRFQLSDVGTPQVYGPYATGDDRGTFVVQGRADSRIVKSIELRQGRMRHRQPMPVAGIFVMGIDGRQAGTVRFLDQEGNKVADKRFQPWRDDVPARWNVPRPSAHW